MRRAAFHTASRISILSTKFLFIIADAAENCKVISEFSGVECTKKREINLFDFHKKFLAA